MLSESKGLQLRLEGPATVLRDGPSLCSVPPQHKRFRGVLPLPNTLTLRLFRNSKIQETRHRAIPTIIGIVRLYELSL